MTEPIDLIDLGRRVEGAGWDGFFLWDHVHGSSDQAMPVVDPWVVLGGLAVTTTRLRLGTSVTAVPRRRPQELARQVVTLDRLSRGRAVLGVGLGEPPTEYLSYGESADRRVLAARLDEGLEVLAGLWSGKPYSHKGDHFVVEDAMFVPTATQQPHPPVWASCVVQNDATLGRAARWDGVILVEMGRDGAIHPMPLRRLVEARAVIASRRGMDRFDIAVTMPSLPHRDELEAYGAAGATWVLVTGWIDQLDELVTRLHPG